MTDIIVFAGTTEGRMLGEYLAENNVRVTLCVATEYSLQLIESSKNLEVLVKRLDTEQMMELITEKNCQLILDATHPYAGKVTENIKAATMATKTNYMRLTRGTGQCSTGELVTLPTVEAVVGFLEQTPMKTLLTIGSKELAHFTRLENFDKNIFARVLPFTEVVEKCTGLGFKGRQLICMQGPFSHSLNVAMINDLGIECLVTKDSGAVGGMEEKLSAVGETGIKTIVIGRPEENEVGYTYDEMKNWLNEKFNIQNIPEAKPRKMFPVFIPLENKKILVVGGGRIAERRINTLLDFGGKITLLSPTLTGSLKEKVAAGEIIYTKANYNIKKLDEFDAIFAATNSREVNHQIGLDSKSLGIPVNVADKKEESDFYFPGIIRGERLVAGIVSVNGDHGQVKTSANYLRKVWEDIETSN